MAYDRIYPGQIWLDTNGKPIQAHGFSVFYSEQDGRYYWYLLSTWAAACG